MKTFKKGDEFKRVKDDINKINDLIKHGWNYCPKSEYKATYKVEKTATEVKTEEKKKKKK